MSQAPPQEQAREQGQRGRQPASGGQVLPRGAGVYPNDLVPIARAGDVIEIVTAQAREAHEVLTVVTNPTIRAFDSNLSNEVTATSNQVTSDQSATELEQREGWLAQYRMVFPSEIPSGINRVLVDLGGAQAPLYTSKQNRGHIERDTAALVGYSAVTELYIWEDEAPQFSFDNGTGSSITVQDLRFAGYQYELSAPIDLPSNVQPVVVPVEAIASQG